MDHDSADPGSLYSGCRDLSGRKQGKSEEAVSDAEEIETDTVVYQGKKYRYNSDLELILFMGVDKSESISLQNHAGAGGQTDTLLLAVLDREQEKVQIWCRSPEIP